jgi:hypothetical protein
MPSLPTVAGSCPPIVQRRPTVEPGLFPFTGARLTVPQRSSSIGSCRAPGQRGSEIDGPGGAVRHGRLELLIRLVPSPGGLVTLLGDPVAPLGLLVPPFGDPVTLFSRLVTLLGRLVPLVPGPITLPCGVVAPVSGLVTLFGAVFTTVAGLIALVAGPIAHPGDRLPRVPRPVTPSRRLITPVTGPSTPPCVTGPSTPPCRLITPVADVVQPCAGPITPIPGFALAVGTHLPITHAVHLATRLGGIVLAALHLLAQPGAVR